MNERNKRITGGLSPLLAVVLFLTSTTDNALTADDKACSQQERTNKTLSEKLQTAGVFVATLILPSGAHTQRREDTGYPATGQPWWRSDRPAQVTLAIAERPAMLITAVGQHRLAFNRRDLAERKREPCGFYARLSVKPKKEVELAPRSSAPITHQRCPTSSSRAGNPDDERKFAVKLERLAALPSLKRQDYFEREGKDGEERNFPWPPKIFAAAPSD